MTTKVGIDPERVRRTMTFWLRPAFVLRVVNRFQKIAGFDRAIALASSAFTALIPLLILLGAILPHVDAEDAARRIITRYGLTDGGAQAVKDVLAPATGTSTQVSVIGALLLVIATLSFSRGMQRLIEQTWELKPLSVRNTLNDLVWIIGLLGYLAVSWWIHGLLDVSRVQIATNAVLLPVSALFLGWSGWILSAKRIRWRGLVPFAILGSVLAAICFAVEAVYLPHLFSSYVSRYGVVGAVLAMISALFVLMVAIVVSAAIGHEVSDELARIARGERPPDDEVKREWDAVIEHARSKWRALRDDLKRRRDRTGTGGSG